MEGIRRSIGRALRHGRAPRGLAVALIILVAHLAATAMLACPNCKDAVASQEGQGLADGLNYTVLGMVSLPFLLVGTVAAVIIRAYIKRST